MSNTLKVGDQFTLRAGRTGADWMDMTYGLVYQIIKIQGGSIYWRDDVSDARGTPTQDFPTDFDPIRVQYNPIDPKMLDRGDHVVCVSAGGDPFGATTPGNHYQITDVCDTFVCWIDDDGEPCSNYTRDLAGKFALAGEFTILGRPVEPAETVAEVPDWAKPNPPTPENIGFGVESIQFIMSRHNIHVEEHHARTMLKLMLVYAGDIPNNK